MISRVIFRLLSDNNRKLDEAITHIRMAIIMPMGSGAKNLIRTDLIIIINFKYIRVQLLLAHLKYSLLFYSCKIYLNEQIIYFFTKSILLAQYFR